MKQKKSQITVFLILGILMIFLIGAVLYIINKTNTDKFEKTAETIEKKHFDVQPIDRFVSECLKTTTDDALTLIGKQGGYIYTSQGGLMLDYRDSDNGLLFQNYDGYRVSYLIYPLYTDIGNYHSSPPEYPWSTFPNTTTFQTYEGIFGISKLPPINNTYGPQSIKSQIESYIHNGLNNCINWEIFKNQGFTIIEQDPIVNLIIGREDLTILLDYPLEITKQFVEGKEYLQKFYYNLDIRLYHIYNLVNTLITNDNTNIEFDISTANLGSGLSVKVQRDTSNHDDLITVKDSQSILNNVPYEFVFARHNRPPALHYFEPNRIIVPYLFNITDQDIIPGGITNLEASDPDEDILNITSYSIDPEIPHVIRLSSMDFTVKVTDLELEDFQTIEVIRQ